MTEQVPASAPEEPERKRGSVGKILLVIVSVLIVVAIVAVLKLGFDEVKSFFAGNTAKAAAGDCITEGATAEEMRTVACAEVDAAFRVVGIGEDKMKSEADQTCREFLAAEDFLFIYEGANADTARGRVLCLEKLDKEAPAEDSK